MSSSSCARGASCPRKGLPDFSRALPVIFPHMNLLPPEVQQQVLETKDPSAWVAKLASVLRSMEPTER